MINFYLEASTHIALLCGTVQEWSGEMKDQNGSTSVDMDDLVVDGDTVGSVVPFHKKLMQDALREDSGVSSAARLAAKIRSREREAEKSRGTTGDSRNATRPDVTGKVKGHWGDVLNLGKLQPSTVATILKKSVIYDNGGPGVTNNISALLPTLAHLLRSTQTVAMETPSLHLIHRLDKETTGVMMLARSAVTARQLHQQFFRREMQKKYWVVTVGVPDPCEGVIDIPLIDKEVAGKNRMTVNPEVGQQYADVLGPGKKRSRGLTAVTNFRVISENGTAALVELMPETGVKHQLRVHMSQGMGCPILGDHKYFHHHKLAPQILPKSLLRSFGIEQPKVRGIPMHLHAKQLRIPNFQDGRALSVSVRLPRYFAKTLHKLKLRIP
ncbi:pseudouridylate synthase RPUSD4, mitochondrial-like isoform X2 [Apostichopus japonicus]|uniref:pseudouridylate synthase RPUSD4, mitochondrial-like isoform X2 n=1 Tax=Stichopus japonicus TaxID=307972 RepID=UPI003AB2EA03